MPHYNYFLLIIVPALPFIAALAFFKEVIIAYPEDLDAKYENESLEIGYNFRYLLDILAEIKCDTVIISFADGSSPSVIHDTRDASAIYVLMPMRV